MSEPTCRSCYAATLTDEQRERFYAEPVTSCVHFCDEHQLPQIQLIKATTTMFELPFATEADS